LFNAAFAIAILDLISQVQLPSFVNMPPKYLKNSTILVVLVIHMRHNTILYLQRLYSLVSSKTTFLDI